MRGDGDCPEGRWEGHYVRVQTLGVAEAQIRVSVPAFHPSTMSDFKWMQSGRGAVLTELLLVKPGWDQGRVLRMSPGSWE